MSEQEEQYKRESAEHWNQIHQTVAQLIADRDKLAAALSAAESRAAKAEAIVAKLPKTADGVPIVPGMEIYGRPNGSRLVVWSVASDRVKVTSDPVEQHDVEVHATQLLAWWFSTREAALAAASEQAQTREVEGEK